MLITNDLNKAYAALNAGKIIAYPTEAVYGLGCDAFNEEALRALLLLKARDHAKGFIVLINSWEQLEALVEPLTALQKDKLRKTWPGAVTWVCPAKNGLPKALMGDHNSIAIRMTAHPIARLLCAKIPIVSTSANLSGMPAARSIDELKAQFDKDIALIVEGSLGNALKPTPVYDLLTGTVYRE